MITFCSGAASAGGRAGAAAASRAGSAAANAAMARAASGQSTQSKITNFFTGPFRYRYIYY